MKAIRRLIAAAREDLQAVREVLHLQAERIRINVYAEEVERERDGLPPADRGLALAWADLLDSLAGHAETPTT